MSREIAFGCHIQKQKPHGARNMSGLSRKSNDLTASHHGRDPSSSCRRPVELYLSDPTTKRWVCFKLPSLVIAFGITA
jgi:hypothetical protein